MNTEWQEFVKATSDFTGGKISCDNTRQEVMCVCLCVWLFKQTVQIRSAHPLQVFIFDHLELDLTPFVSFQGGGQLSLHKAAVAHNDQICKFCGQQRNMGCF